MSPKNPDRPHAGRPGRLHESHFPQGKHLRVYEGDLVEAGDNLTEGPANPFDILSIKGFWRNKVTRVLLVVVFTNLGSAVGTFVAIPMMMKYL